MPSIWFESRKVVVLKLFELALIRTYPLRIHRRGRKQIQNSSGPLLSLGDTRAQAFTQEHLRLAKSLAIPAAVAIQNARLYERAEIFRAELEQRLADLEQAQKEPREVQQGRELS